MAIVNCSNKTKIHGRYLLTEPVQNTWMDGNRTNVVN